LLTIQSPHTHNNGKETGIPHDRNILFLLLNNTTIFTTTVVTVTATTAAATALIIFYHLYTGYSQLHTQNNPRF
jgi:hypothetical protein